MTESARIASLEAQVRTLKRMLFGVFGLVVAGSVLGATSLQTVPDVIQAKKFEVVDANDQVIMSMKPLPGSTGQLSIIGKNKKTAIRISPNGFEALNDSGTLAATMGKSTFNDSGALTVFDDAGRPTVLICNEEQNGVQFGTVSTISSKAQFLVTMGVSEGGFGALAIENGKGKPIVQLGGAGDGDGFISTKNQKGDTLVKLGSFEGARGGYIETFSATGVSTSELP